MPGFYRDGFDVGYGRRVSSFREAPETDYDSASYQKGIEDGQRRRRIADEIDAEDY